MQKNTVLGLSFLLILCLFSPSSEAPAAATPTPTASSHSISTVFAFGDSTLDSGNNNFIHTIVRANHTPYGHDFPGHVPTGRFSNGKLITDFLVSALGLKQYLPPFAANNLTTADLLTGVSFASAGSGLDQWTATLSFTTSIENQERNFEAYLSHLTSLVGREKASKVVEDALFVISTGSNDMIRYYADAFTTKSPNSYHDFLLGRMRRLVQRLISLGGRRFTIAGLPPIGCVPMQMTFAGITQGRTPLDTLTQRSCVRQQNLDAIIYNSKLQPMIKSLMSSFPAARIAYVDIYKPLMDMIRHPEKYGFVETKLGCCGFGGFEMGPGCGLINPFTRICQDPSKYLFWDSVHPTQATYQALADTMMMTVLSDILK